MIIYGENLMRPSQLLRALPIMQAVNLPIMLWGSPGIGKSDLVREFAIMGKRKVFDERLALLDPTDLRGIPYFDPETKTAKWGLPSMLPTLADGSTILFLDEINAAPPSIQAAAYQLVLDRRVGDYYLPDDCFIIAAGNLETDKAVTHSMPSPLLNRFTHITLEVSTDDWIKWAMQNNIHADIVGYLEYQKGDLHQFDSRNMNERGFPTPRSWAKSSKILQESERAFGDDKETNRLVQDLISGTIGEGMSVQFFAHRNISKYLPQPIDVLSGSVKTLHKKVKDEISAHYTMIISSIYEMKNLSEKKNMPSEYLDNFLLFCDSNFGPEFCTMALNKVTHSGISADAFRNSKNGSEIISKYAELL